MSHNVCMRWVNMQKKHIFFNFLKYYQKNEQIHLNFQMKLVKVDNRRIFLGLVPIFDESQHEKEWGAKVKKIQFFKRKKCCWNKYF